MFYCFILAVWYCYNFTLQERLWIMKHFLQTSDKVNYCAVLYKAFFFFQILTTKRLTQTMVNTREIMTPCVDWLFTDNQERDWANQYLVLLGQQPFSKIGIHVCVCVCACVCVRVCMCISCVHLLLCVKTRDHVQKIKCHHINNDPLGLKIQQEVPQIFCFV